MYYKQDLVTQPYLFTLVPVTFHLTPLTCSNPVHYLLELAVSLQPNIGEGISYCFFDLLSPGQV